MSLTARWRSSLSLRVLVFSSVLTIVLVIGSASLLMARVQQGVLDAKVSESLVDSAVALDSAREIIESFDPNFAANSPRAVVNSIVSTLARRSGQPPAYEVLLLANGGGPERSTNQVQVSTVPINLILEVYENSQQFWAYTQINYADSAPVSGIVVGAPILLPGETQYGLFLVYPTIQQQEIVDVVQSAIILFAIVLSIGIVSIVGFLTKRITDPVREAADTAQRIASGLIDQRLTVKGKDEIARWAESFNSMTDSLEQQITKLKSLSMEQQRFVSDVSHELRTPVTTVRMAADLLHEQRSTFPPEVARAAELLQSELDRFEVMLSDLLEISRIDAGAAPLNIARCRIHELILETLDSVRPLAVQFNVDLVFKEPSSELTLDCDKRRIQRALRNLIVNAISHSQSPSIEIEAHLSELTVTISVTDFGVGINPDQLKHVFERFWRADPARSRDKGGSGLGLSIAMQDVEQHQGKLLAESGPEIKGTIFKIQLPVKQPGISHEM